ncbi:AAA family ATPase [Nonomuraea sp. NPDC047897]|uniref:MinD/ParA family ATP-binding protein n=1 Tax=Nonomuraea sp. NPDC047897 TaxID=3364346 RepID=UPI003714A8D8
MARQDREESLEEQLAWLDAIKETDEAPLKVGSPAAATADEPVASPYPEDPWASVAALHGETPTPPLFRAAVDSVYGPHAADGLPAGESEATEWLETATPQDEPATGTASAGPGPAEPQGRADDPFLAPLKPLPRSGDTDPAALSSFSGGETLSGDETLPRLDRPEEGAAWPEPPGWPSSPSALDEPSPAAEPLSGRAAKRPDDEPGRSAFAPDPAAEPSERPAEERREDGPGRTAFEGRPEDEPAHSPFELRLNEEPAWGSGATGLAEEPRHSAFEVPSPAGDAPAGEASWGSGELSWQRPRPGPEQSAAGPGSADTLPAGPSGPGPADTLPAVPTPPTAAGATAAGPTVSGATAAGPTTAGPSLAAPSPTAHGAADAPPASPVERPEAPAPERARRPAPVPVFGTGTGTTRRPPVTGRPTADSLDPETLLRGRRNAPSKGWRRLVYKASGGWIKPGEPPEVRRRRELISRARTPVATGHHRVAVLSLKGGVGKTTTTVGLGATLAQMRGDRVIAIDANPDRGTLSDKLHLETSATVRDLLNERDQVKRYVDIRAFTSQAPSRLEVLASDRDPSVSEAFSGADYQAVSQVLENFYSICITDCGTGLLHSAMGGVLGLADQIVLVSSPSVDGARAASATLDWLEAHHYGDLVKDATVVLCSVRPRSKSAVDIGKLEAHFAARCRAVVRVPYDPHLEEGAEIDLDRLQESTRDAYLQLAASVGDGFAGAADGYAGTAAGGFAGGREWE